MEITKQQLQQLIDEEFSRALKRRQKKLSEGIFGDDDEFAKNDEAAEFAELKGDIIRATEAFEARFGPVLLGEVLKELLDEI